MEAAVKVTDPVCGMEVSPENAAGSSTHGGQTYYFCSTSCKERFDADPASFARATAGAPPAGQAPVPGPSAHTSATPDGRERVTLPITGMSCAACAARIERSLKQVEGVRHASVNFAIHRATVEYDPQLTDTRALVQLIHDAGYATGDRGEARFYVNDSECMTCTTPKLEAAVRRIPGVIQGVYNPATSR